MIYTLDEQEKTVSGGDPNPYDDSQVITACAFVHCVVSDGGGEWGGHSEGSAKEGDRVFGSSVQGGICT